MKNVRPIISLETALGITDFEKFNPAIPNESLESNIDKFSCKLIVSTVSIGRCNTANIMPLRHWPQKRVLKKKRTHCHMDCFLTDEMNTVILNNTDNKIMELIEQLSEDVCNNYRYTCGTYTYLLVSHMQWVC